MAPRLNGRTSAGEAATLGVHVFTEAQIRDSYDRISSSSDIFERTSRSSNVDPEGLPYYQTVQGTGRDK